MSHLLPGAANFCNKFGRSLDEMQGRERSGVAERAAEVAHAANVRIRERKSVTYRTPVLCGVPRCSGCATTSGSGFIGER
jgi:hypothetical protein